ncbi:peptide MFS transporter [Flavobacterium aquatile]|uniref:Amino acid transporter n=1 Tax=Flavobacterium aquatile LMG 4008 = ATCC 11947 TaxID=1453498 RepID=A0A095TZT8_9FLAO|nr:peptide MFS transporter [Flavobacterium aquatile]KGD67923.1 amino acid transporter [Flavobacterium aquatile LMG 4008 = ATCC 11947]OXA65402.1 MFS transporter [Flavobacterium aquatile] [Flavobacterium aquatile LMG 4008 = ATCC 11947]GEC78962.1 MFS transporter [Flavobacterium aquatile]
MEINQSIEEIQNFKGKYPKQLWYLFFSEMWERFCFYGMRGMLVVFMVNHLAMDEKTANLQYGATQAWVYAFTFIGGLFADKILGLRKSLFWGGILMIIGSVILAIDPKSFFFIGLGFTIVGTGFFKPNISSMVGQLYKNDDPRRDAGFSFFYMGVNLGALIGGYICIAVAEGSMWQSVVPENLRWNVGFGFAAVVMIISLLTFTQTQKSLGPIGLSPLMDVEKSKKKILEIATYAGSLIIVPIIIIMVANTKYTDYFMMFIGPASILYLFYEMKNFSSAENKKLLAALVFIIFSIFFWAFFEQSGGSLSLFAANNLNNDILGVELSPNGVNNSANSFFVIGFAALVGLVWLWMAKRKIEPNTVIKFGLAFIFLAGGFWIFYYTKFFADLNGRTSLGIFTFGWFIITFGELCLSPIGMSAMTKLSPQKTQAVIMGMWFLASAYGQYFAGLLGANIAEASENATNLEKLNVYADGYYQLGIYALVAGVVLIAISPLIKKLMQEVK